MEKSNHYQPAVEYHTMNGWQECTSKGSGKFHFSSPPIKTKWDFLAYFMLGVAL